MDVSQISHKAITLQKGELQKYGADYPRAHIWKGALSSFGQNVKLRCNCMLEYSDGVSLKRRIRMSLEMNNKMFFLLIDTKMKKVPNQ